MILRNQARRRAPGLKMQKGATKAGRFSHNLYLYWLFSKKILDTFIVKKFIEFKASAYVAKQQNA